MSYRKVRTLPESIRFCEFVSVHYCADLNEYRVSIIGNKKATYYTNDRNDAITTAQRMRNEYLSR